MSDGITAWEDNSYRLVVAAIDPSTAADGKGLFANEIPRERNVMPMNGLVLDGVNDAVLDAVALQNNYGNENRWVTRQELDEVSLKYPGVGVKRGEKPVQIASHNRYHAYAEDHPLNDQNKPGHRGLVNVYNLKQIAGWPEAQRSKELEDHLVRKRNQVIINTQQNLQGEFGNQAGYVGVRVAHDFEANKQAKGKELPPPAMKNLVEAVAAYSYAKEAGSALQTNYNGSALVSDMKDFSPRSTLLAIHVGSTGAKLLRNPTQSLENGRNAREANTYQVEQRDLSLGKDLGGMEM